MNARREIQLKHGLKAKPSGERSSVFAALKWKQNIQHVAYFTNNRVE